MNNQLEPTEVAVLKELSEVYETSCTPGWMRIMKLAEEEVDKAHEDMVGNMSSDPMIYMRLQIRWQQREIAFRAIKEYVQTCIVRRKEILDEIRERERSSYEQQSVYIRETA